MSRPAVPKANTEALLREGTPMTRPRVLLAEDHPIVAEGVRGLLAADFDLLEVAEDGHALVEAAHRLLPDVVVADISMPSLNGIEALAAMRRDGLWIPVVFLSMHRDVAYVRRALEAGAAGYVLKQAATTELLQGVRSALEGGTFVSPAVAGQVSEVMKRGPATSSGRVGGLTLRQLEILRMLAEGLSAKEIAAKADISPRTVEFHKYQMMEALHAKRSVDLVRFAIRHGIAER